MIKYRAYGDYKFYRFLLVYALNKLIVIENNTYSGDTPNIELLKCHDQFLVMYRRGGGDIYLHIARVFRKASHKIYRVMLKKNMIMMDRRFLNLVVKCQ